MKKHLFISVSIILFMFSFVHAQDNQWVQYTSADTSGVPSNTVNDFAFNGMTTVIATSAGVAVFDGINWITYNTLNSPLPSNNVLSVAIDSAGVIWAGTISGGARLDSAGWTVWTITGNDAPWGVVDWIRITDIQIDEDGMPWFSDNRAIRYIEDDSLMFVEESWLDHVWAGIAIDTAGIIWMANTEEGLHSWDGTDNVYYDDAPTSFFTAIDIDTTTNLIWLATRDSGLISYDRTTYTQYNEENSEIPSDSIKYLSVDSAGTVWMVLTGGIASFDGETFEFYGDTTAGFPISQARTINVDQFNNKWIGTPGVIIFHEEGVTVDVDNIPIDTRTNLAVWPNPVPDVVQVQSDRIVDRVELYNSSGKLVLSSEPAMQQFSLSTGDLPRGVYIIRAITSEGQRIGKIVK